MTNNKYTLIFVIDNDRVLLLNRFNSPAKGTWCGLGGHIENGENPKLGALRELEEESGIKLNDLKYSELIQSDSDLNYVFYAQANLKDFIGVKVTEEGVLSCLPIDWILNNKNVRVTEFTRKALRKITKGD